MITDSAVAQLRGPEEAQRVVFGDELATIAAEDPDTLVLDGDLANSTRADIVSDRVPDQFLEMGIAEQNMVGVAAGLATVGFRPWVTTFAIFLAERALDQVRMVVAQTHLNVKLAGAYSGLRTGYTGKTHQSVADIAIMRAMPEMRVVCPGEGPEVRAVMRAMHEYEGPVYLRLTRDESPRFLPDGTPFVWGKGYEVRQGRDVTIVATGLSTIESLRASELLEAEGISAAVIHQPSIKPFDPETLLRSAAATGHVVTVEEHNVLGGLGGLVAETLSEQLPTPVKRLGIRDSFGASGSNADLLRHFELDGPGIARSVADWLASR